MKNLLKLLGIIAIVAMVGFTLASCGGGATSPAEVVEPPPTDDTVWETVIEATVSTNGYQEAVSGLKKGDRRTLYATGSEGITFNDGVADASYATTVTVDDDEIVYIPAKYNPLTSGDKDFSYSKYTDVKELAGVQDDTTLVVFLPLDTSVNAKAKEYTVKKIGGFAARVKGTEVGVDEDDEAVYKFVIPEGVTEISDDAFKSNTGITEIVFPKTLTAIGASAFQNITYGGTISIPDTVTKIGDGAFKGAVNVDIVVPAGVKEVGAGAFENVKTVVVTGASKAPSGWAEDFAGDVNVIYIPIP